MKTILLALLLTVPVLGQAETGPLEAALAGKDFPLTLKLKDLDATWRRFSTSTFPVGYPVANNSVMFTKGQTVKVGDETFLVAYRLLVKTLDPQQAAQAIAWGGRGMMMQGGGMPGVAEPDKPTAVSPVVLTLLNLRTTPSLLDVRAFNLDVELGGTDPLVGEGADNEAGAASIKNLRQIGVALLTYVSERKVLPALQDAKSAREELILYLRDKEVLNVPGAGKPYTPNAALSGKKPGDFEKPEKVIVFYEPTAGADGTRGCLFLDGHAERVADQQWKKYKELSQIP